MRTFVCGDFHGGLDIRKISGKNWKESRDFSRDDVLIQLGDFGLVWNEDKEEKYWLDWIDERPYTFAFVDGNHENFDLLEKYPCEEKWDGEVSRIRDNVFWLRRGEIYNINGKSILAMGGATSTDKHLRLPGKSWWPQENWSFLDTMYITEQALSSEVDIVVSHTCPSDCIRMLIQSRYDNIDCKVSVEMNNLIRNGFRPKQWHFGHFHTDIAFKLDNIEFFCHYNNQPYEVK